jgi:hypothetical protein
MSVEILLETVQVVELLDGGLGGPVGPPGSNVQRGALANRPAAAAAAGVTHEASDLPWHHRDKLTYSDGTRWLYQDAGYGPHHEGGDNTGVADSTSALNTAATNAAASGIKLHLPRGAWKVTGAFASSAHVHVERGALFTGAGTVTLDDGYTAGAHQVFASTVTARVMAHRCPEILPEHFGAVAMADARASSPDSTTALQRMFLSLKGSTAYNPGTDGTPAAYAGWTVFLSGHYGTSDQLGYNASNGRITGHGSGLNGSGLKWIGTENAANATKAMLRGYGADGVRIDSILLQGCVTATEANRLAAAIAFTSHVGVAGGGTDAPAPFNSTVARGCVVEDVRIGEYVGWASDSGSFASGILCDGDDANNDFHTFRKVTFTRCLHGITLAGAQSVNHIVEQCRFNAPTKSGLWLKRGGDGLLLDGVYWAAFPSTAWLVRLGDASESSPPARYIQLTCRNVTGELNTAAGGVVYNELASDSGFSLVMDTCGVLVSSATPFVGGTACAWRIVADGCELWTRFRLSANTQHRNVLRLRGCRGLASTTVEITQPLPTLDVEVDGGWAQNFTAAPAALSAAGRLVGPLNTRRVLDQTTAGTPVALGDASLFGATTANARRVRLGLQGFGPECEEVAEHYRVTTLAQNAQTLAGLLPANALVKWVKAAAESSNYLAAHNEAYAQLCVGGAALADYRKYGVLLGPGGNNEDFYVEPGFAPFHTSHANAGGAGALAVVLRGVWNRGDTYTWSGTTVTAATGGLSAAMIGSQFMLTSGGNAFEVATITAVPSATTLTVDVSKTASGTGCVLIPFAAGKIIHVQPRYELVSAGAGALATQGTNWSYGGTPLTPT